MATDAVQNLIGGAFQAAQTDRFDDVFNPSTGDFSDTATVGYYLVGQLVTAKDANGMIEFIARRWADPIESDET